MKYLLKFAFAAAALILIFASCEKANNLPNYSPGLGVNLSSSVAALAPAAVDSNKTVITFSWNNPGFATDPATCKYIVEIDSAGRNFSKEVTKTVIGSLTTSFIAKDLNAIFLGFGFNYNTPYDVEVRLTASYGNNNDMERSNVIRLRVTPYVIPPKIAPPTSGRLFLVGDASQGGWGNPVPVPTQEFAKLDSVTFGGVFNIVGGKQYLALPVNGDWSHKYAVQDNSIPGLSAGGDFGYDFPQNFPGPSNSGWYVIIFSFQTGKFIVTPFTGNLPANLFMVGDATPGGWGNPVPVPSQQFTRLNSSVFQLTINLTGGKQYLFLPVNGDWSHKYAVQDNSVGGLSAGGAFGYDFPQNFPGPANSGSYKVTVNFVTGRFSVQ